MSDRIRKALRADAGKLEITIEADYGGNIKYCVHERAFRLDGYKRGELTAEQLDAAEDADAMIRDTISETVRNGHISWEARQ